MTGYGGGTGSGIGARPPSRSILNGTIILFKYYNFIGQLGMLLIYRSLFHSKIVLY